MTGKLKTTDPFWWALFSLGGTVAAFLVPIHVLITGLGIGFGWVSAEVVDYERIEGLLTHLLVKLYLFGFISLSLFHWAHRFRYVLMDIGLRSLKAPVALLCYGGAAATTAFTAFLLVVCV